MISKNKKPSNWVKKAIENIEPGGSLIDIACGEGRHSKYLSRKFYVYAVDINKTYLEKLSKIPNIETIAQEIVDLLKPTWLRIGAYWYPRGGIPIDVFWQTGQPPEDIFLPNQDFPIYKGRG